MQVAAIPKPAPVATMGAFNACLGNARKAAEPGTRDRNRLDCIKKHGARLPVLVCVKSSEGMEYSFNAEAGKSYCMFETGARLTPDLCARVARSMAYGANRDEMIWGCLRRQSLKISIRDCEKLAKLMVFRSQKDRAFMYCENEIAAAR